MQRSRILFTAPLCLCLAALGCAREAGPTGLDMPTGTGGPRGTGYSGLLPFDPGVRLTDTTCCIITFSGGSRQVLAWSADASEVFYVVYKNIGPPQFGIRAKSVLDSTAPERRVVDTGDLQVVALAAAPDPTWLYYYLVAPTDSMSGSGLYRVPAEGGTPELVDANASFSTIVIAPDGSRVAYQAAYWTGRDDSDSIFVFQSATGSKESVSSAAGGDPVAFSPDGLRLLFERFVGRPDSLGWDTLGLYVADLAADSARRLNDPLAPDPDNPTASSFPYASLNWGSQGIRRAVSNADDGFLQDLEAGTETGLAMDGYVGGSCEDRAVAGWAPDGSPAAWKEDIVCGGTRAALYGFDPSGGSSQVLAVVAGTIPYSPIAFSPDGLRVAYIGFDTSATGPGVFVHDVRR